MKITKEKAIKNLENRLHNFLLECETTEAISLAIEALKQPNIVRCKDCKHRPELKLYSDRHGNYTVVEFPDGSKCPCQCEDFFYSWYPKDDWFCANGERENND